MSIVTTLASLVHAVLVITEPGVWEGIFGMEILTLPDSKLTMEAFPSFFAGAVSVAVAIIVSNMSVIIPAILRALGVGDPFMQEDTVDPSFSTIEMARATSTTIELGLPKTRGMVVTDSAESEGAIRMTTFKQQDSGDLGTKDDHKHKLTMQASDISLGSSKMKVLPFADEYETADSFVGTGEKPTPGREGLETKVGIEGESVMSSRT